MKSKKSDIVSGVFIYAFVGIVSIVCLLPFLQVLSTSISSDAAVNSRRVILIPKGFNINAYKTVFGDSSMMHSMLFTVVLTLAFTAFGMLLTILAAYPLTIGRFKGKKIFMMIFIVTMYFSAGTIPDYLLINNLKMINTVWSLILPLSFSAFNVIILKSFIENTIPASLTEAAILDGCSDIRILVNIVLPLSKPVLVTLCLFFAVGRWNTFQDALYYITKPSLYPLQLKLNQLISSASDNSTSLSQEIPGAQMTSPEVLKAACIMFATIPIVIVYPFLQKYFIKGAMIGAVKG